MRIEYDRDVDALYIRIQEKEIAESREVSDGVILDLDEQGLVIGFEVLDAARNYSLRDIFNLSTENLILEKTG